MEEEQGACRRRGAREHGRADGSEPGCCRSRRHRVRPGRGADAGARAAGWMRRDVPRRRSAGCLRRVRDRARRRPGRGGEPRLGRRARGQRARHGHRGAQHRAPRHRCPCGRRSPRRRRGARRADQRRGTRRTAGESRDHGRWRSRRVRSRPTRLRCHRVTRAAPGAARRRAGGEAGTQPDRLRLSARRAGGAAPRERRGRRPRRVHADPRPHRCGELDDRATCSSCPVAPRSTPATSSRSSISRPRISV